MDETRAINGNLPHADIYRTKAASSADDGDGGGLGNAYEKATRQEPDDDAAKDQEVHKGSDLDEHPGSDPLLQALDRMKAVEGYHPVDQSEVAQHQAERAYGSSSVRRKIDADTLSGNISKLEQHGALEERRVDDLLDELADDPHIDEVDYLPHDHDHAS